MFDSVLNCFSIDAKHLEIPVKDFKINNLKGMKKRLCTNFNLLEKLCHLSKMSKRLPIIKTNTFT